MGENGPTRTETFPVGIVGVGLAGQRRQVPTAEPPPLPPNAELAVIGKPYPRDNGRAKVTGAIRFTVDVGMSGMLFARILRSPHAHAEVRAIDTDVAERDPRVRAIVRAVALGDPTHSVVRYVGQPVVAIAATSMAAAEEALSLVRVDYKALPFVVDLDEARRPASPKVYDPGTAPGSSAGELVAQTGLPLPESTCSSGRMRPTFGTIRSPFPTGPDARRRHTCTIPIYFGRHYADRDAAPPRPA